MSERLRLYCSYFKTLRKSFVADDPHNCHVILRIANTVRKCKLTILDREIQRTMIKMDGMMGFATTDNF
jgi:hypothetical protein